MAAEVQRSAGTVKWFNAQKGFGFIAPDDGGEDLFVHQTSIRSDGFRTLSEGEAVEFSVDHADDGRTKAVDVDVRFRPAPSSRGRGRGGFRGRGGAECYNCGRTGHLAQDCYHAGEGRGSREYGGRGGGRGYGSGDGGGGGRGYGGGGGRGGGRRGCYNCGEEGHLARECVNDQK